ncbi:hypothetical protein EG349_08530 [Chryseobacterium shandongense]|uniref:Uncharacterized protein n=1 Tax=Chryseobacterium shandongense TaxID=1493872 RepID=A0AAD0Y9V3_9FLAO|nr:hypothetical protein [Chryseobacterium shandongense]AZA86831.1 hypothetical protein EG349_08530 [Chryseobacterium shandongense]AZA95246.1 hypothetical protein EG353_06575 [Chryseobacterium shandongense]
MINNSNKIKNKVRFRNASNASSEALKFVKSLHDAMGSQLAYINFYQRKNGRFSSKYLPNVSFELKKNLYNGKEGVVLLVYDENNKTTVTSKYIKRVVEFSFFDDKLVLPFLTKDLEEGLGYTNYHKDVLRQYFVTFLQVTFRLGNNDVVLRFDYNEKNDRPKLSFRGEDVEKYSWTKFSKLERGIVKNRLKIIYEENWGESLDINKSRFCNF